jgi:hypothetical protein
MRHVPEIYQYHGLLNIVPSVFREKFPAAKFEWCGQKLLAGK